MKVRPIYDYFVYFIIFVKVIYVALAVSLLYIKFKNHGTCLNSIEELKVTYWKERVELIFIINMSVLLIYLFYPWREKVIIIDDNARVLLFAYGIIILFAGKWSSVLGGWIYDKIKRNKKHFGRGSHYFGGGYDDGEIFRKHIEIDYKIKKSENIRNLQDYPNMQNFSRSNADYQKYYTLIYPPDTIGAVNYPRPVEVSDAASNFSNRFPPRSSL